MLGNQQTTNPMKVCFGLRNWALLPALPLLHMFLLLGRGRERKKGGGMKLIEKRERLAGLSRIIAGEQTNALFYPGLEICPHFCSYTLHTQSRTHPVLWRHFKKPS